MIPTIEFYYALSFAVAAASSPGETETPMPESKKLTEELQAVCMDFWPGNSLRIAGTNGRRLVVSYLTVKGLPDKGRFLMPLDKAAEILMTFTPGGRTTLGLFGESQMMFTSGENYAIVDAAGTPYPEYHQVLEGDAPPTKGAVYDGGTLHWVLGQVAPVSAGPLAIHMRAYGSTILRPQMRAGFECLHDVVFAIRPLSVQS